MSDRIEAEILDVLGEEVAAAVDTPLVVIEGPKGDPGAPGKDGITPTIGQNGNWYLGEEDTGKPSRGETGPQGTPGVYYGTTPPTGDTHPVWIDPDGGPDDGGLLPAVTAADNGKVLRVVNSAWSAEDMPTGGTDMGITGAKVGQIAKITAVDASGAPTAWAPVDMPDKLPNPKALTFTGAAAGTYDGSAALSVEIPTGGGDKNWTKVIDTEVTTEEGLFGFEATDIGAYREFFVSMKLPAQTVAPIKIKVGNTYILQDNQGINTTKTTYWECYGIYDGEAWHVEYANGIADTGITYYANTRLNCKQVVSEASTAIAVTVNSGAQAFATGTTCRVVIR